MLIFQALGLIIYTLHVGTNEGWSFIKVAIDNTTALNWNGQFGLDFSCYLLLSGIWIMWRNEFSVLSIVLASVAMIIGIIVFAPYLLYLLVKENGDIKRVLLGNRI